MSKPFASLNNGKVLASKMDFSSLSLAVSKSFWMSSAIQYIFSLELAENYAAKTFHLPYSNFGGFSLYLGPICDAIGIVERCDKLC